MDLNLPILDRLAGCKNLLLAGMGGGFDLFCALPIYFELRRRGQNVHLANLSFSALGGSKQGIRLTKTMVGVNAAYRGPTFYFPELHLARWFSQERNEDVTVWCFELTGVRPLLENYRVLAEHLGLDGILLMDGGVDALMRGNEYETGTPAEDMVSLTAVHALENIPTKLIACLGLGTEEDVSHAHVLENIAALAAQDGFLGSCALIKQMLAYQDYEKVLTYVHQQQINDPSIRGASIVSAVRGHYGDFHLTQKTHGKRLWISPLMTLYWFFELEAVAAQCLFKDALRTTETMDEAMHLVLNLRRSLPIRKQFTIPLG